MLGGPGPVLSIFYLIPLPAIVFNFQGAKNGYSERVTISFQPGVHRIIT